MTERWRRYLSPDEREDYTAWSGMLRDLETAARARMADDDERRRREAEADPLLAANGGDGAWTPDPDYGDDDAT
jgi:hypothetical protein